MNEMKEEFPWLSKCVKIFTVNDYTKQHDMTNIFTDIDIEKTVEKESSNDVEL